MARKRHWSYHGEKRLKDVKRRDGYTCQIGLEGCLGVATEVDHIIPKAWGGSDQPDNLRAACGYCNNKLNDPRTRRRFLGGTQSRRALLRNLSPQGSESLVIADYSRREEHDGDSSG